MITLYWIKLYFISAVTFRFCTISGLSAELRGNGPVTATVGAPFVNLSCTLPTTGPFGLDDEQAIISASWFFRDHAAGRGTQIISCAKRCTTGDPDVKYSLVVDVETEREIVLIISDLQETDEGNYTCTLAGSRDSASAAVELHAKPVPDCDMVRPSISCSPSVTMDTALTVDCIIGGQNPQRAYYSLFRHQDTSRVSLFRGGGGGGLVRGGDGGGRLDGLVINANLSTDISLPNASFSREVRPVEIISSCCRSETDDNCSSPDGGDAILCSEECNSVVLLSPTQPSNLRVTSYSSSSLSLSWRPGNDGGTPATFTISYCSISGMQNGFTNNNSSIGGEQCRYVRDVATPNHRLTALAAYITYRITVRADNGIGLSRNSPPLVTSTAPKTPEDLGIAGIYDALSGKLVIVTSSGSSSIGTLPADLCLHLEIRVATLRHRNETCLQPGHTVYVGGGATEQHLWLVACGRGVCSRPSAVIAKRDAEPVSSPSNRRDMDFLFILLITIVSCVGLLIFILLIVACFHLLVRRNSRSHDTSGGSGFHAHPALPLPSPLTSSPHSHKSLEVYAAIDNIMRGNKTRRNTDAGSAAHQSLTLSASDTESAARSNDAHDVRTSPSAGGLRHSYHCYHDYADPESMNDAHSSMKLRREYYASPYSADCSQSARKGARGDDVLKEEERQDIERNAWLTMGEGDLGSGRLTMEDKTKTKHSIKNIGEHHSFTKSCTLPKAPGEDSSPDSEYLEPMAMSSLRTV